MNNILKLYAAYRTGYIGENILDTYFSLFANVIIDNNLANVDDNEIAGLIENRYDVNMPTTFIRQVLGIGVKNGCFVLDHGRYHVEKSKLLRFRFEENDFYEMWEKMKLTFKYFCLNMEIELDDNNLDSIILTILDSTDDKIITDEFSNENESLNQLEFAWYKFVQAQSERDIELYDFIVALSASNISKQALLFSGNENSNWNQLTVYLDSPIVFALLGMDEKERTNSYMELLKSIISSGCQVKLFDHNLEEIEGICERASWWSQSVEYDISKANNAARFFHDSQMTNEEITLFCHSIAEKINSLGIYIQETDYNYYSNSFQEDESKLFSMIVDKYRENGLELSEERKKSAETDVRSIIMVYRIRNGHTATRITESGHIMITSNNAIANISKLYESNQSINSGHIPACISADLFGALLWLNSPSELMNYQKHKLLADCYSFLRPTKQLIKKYVESLKKAKEEEKIDEKTYLFLRSHSLVQDSLMNVTKGDYARFNNSTYLEVYNDIVANSEKQYNDERLAHLKTIKEKEQALIEKEKAEKTIEEKELALSQIIEKEQNRKEKLFQRKVNTWKWVFIIVFAIIPFSIITVILELIKIDYKITDTSSIILFVILVIAPLIAGFCIDKVKNIVEMYSKHYCNKHYSYYDDEYHYHWRKK